MRVLLVSLVLGLAACGSGDQTAPADSPPPTPEVAPVTLGDLLPDTLLGRARQSLDLSRDGALGAEVERAQARYGEITVSVTDFGTAEMTEMMGYGWALAPDPEQILGHPGKREGAAHSASVQIVVRQRFLIDATVGTEADALAALQALDLTALD